MKYKLITITLCFTICFVCFSLAQSSPKGIWRTTKQLHSLPDTTYTVTGKDIITKVKIINFSNSIQTHPIQKSMFNQGSHLFWDGIYKEHLKYVSKPTIIGETYYFMCKNKDDIWPTKDPLKKTKMKTPL